MAAATTPKPLAAASSQVLHTPELLSLITAHLPARDLLAALRINHTWNAVISRSPTCQQTLYLRASPASPHRSHPLSNPLHIQPFVQQACLRALRALNPSLTLHGMNASVARRAASFADPRASWRRMFLFQPLVKSALLNPMSAHFDVGLQYIANEEGLRMGDVVAFFEAKALEGGTGVDLLVMTLLRKVVWQVMPLQEPPALLTGT